MLFVADLIPPHRVVFCCHFLVAASTDAAARHDFFLHSVTDTQAEPRSQRRDNQPTNQDRYVHCSEVAVTEIRAALLDVLSSVPRPSR
jgi:hypothetical protein